MYIQTRYLPDAGTSVLVHFGCVYIPLALGTKRFV